MSAQEARLKSTRRVFLVTARTSRFHAACPFRSRSPPEFAAPLPHRKRYLPAQPPSADGRRAAGFAAGAAGSRIIGNWSSKDAVGMKPTAIALGLRAFLTLPPLIGGCTATTINTDAPQRANTTLARLDDQGDSTPSRYHDQEIRLWRDQPQYAALVDAPPPVKRMRMISAVAPAYPRWLRLAHVNGHVIVSFVVGVDGRVEDARIIESSDSRFNASALEAIRHFTFIPAEGLNGPTREIAMQPLSFWWSAKALGHTDSSP
jgi:TonB family protein